jgi:hypothetical protein
MAMMNTREESGESGSSEGQQEGADIVGRISQVLYELESDPSWPDCIVVSREVSDYLENRLRQGISVYYWTKGTDGERYFMDIPIKVQDIGIFGADAVIVGKPRFPECDDTLPAYQKVLYHAKA